MSNKLNGFNDGLHPSSGIGGGKSISEITTQLSGLSDYELELEKIVDKIKNEPNTLRCINFLKTLLNESQLK